MADTVAEQRIPGYCALCISRCGSIARVQDGQFVALEPDPSHPTGKALCAKGRAAPELVYHRDRLLYPLMRTRPKTDPDPGWQRISWDQALDLTVTRLREIATDHGPESVVFSSVSPSTSAMADSVHWVQRLMYAFGSPNFCVSMELCGWGRLSTVYTFGAPIGLPGGPMPDIDNAGCILFWGYNPSGARIAHATSAVAAVQRGAKLIVVDPRRAGLATRADLWMRPRPGSDGALALGIANVMIERGWYDETFVRDWTNGPLLVRTDMGRLLTERDLVPGGHENRYVTWDTITAFPVVYDAPTRRLDREESRPALFGEFVVATPAGGVRCRPVFQLVADRCRQFGPREVETLAWVAPNMIEQAARTLWESRPVAYFAWTGLEQHTNATQSVRALALLYALTGSYDSRGGTVQFPAVPSRDVAGAGLIGPEQHGKTLGIRERPIGPAAWDFVTTDDVYRAIQEDTPYPVRGLVGFGANLLIAHADTLRGRDALSRLDFAVHADLFMNPTAELADVVLPVATPFEREALKIGFEISTEAQSHVQLRRPVIEPLGEARPDTDIIFDLAVRLGIGQHFWNGDIDAGYRAQLEPSGVSLETLRAHPEGIHVPLTTRYRKYAEKHDGVVTGFATPTGKVELWSERFLAQGYPPLPDFEEPLVSPRARPDLADRYSLILTCAHNGHFCESQHRAIPSLRKLSRDPEVEMHPDAASARGIAEGDWVRIETPHGAMRARTRFNATIDPRVAVGQHGWWQGCDDLGAPAYDPFSESGANLNLAIGNDAVDPVSGSVPNRSYLCEITLSG